MYSILNSFVKVADNEGISITKLEHILGASKGVLSRAIANKSDIQTKWLLKLVENYPLYSEEWLLTGRGRMLKDDSITLLDKNRKTNDKIIDDQLIPLYNLEATAGLKELFASETPSQILDTIRIPNLPKCDGAITVSGDSMYPLLKSGDIVLYKEAFVEDIFFGEMYLLSVQLNEWDEYITVKYIQRSEVGEDYVKLVSQNQHHQPKDILKAKITALAIVKASIRINTMM